MKRAVLSAMLVLLAAGCSHGPEEERPIGIARGINGLRQSPCHCGGLQPKKDVKSREEADERASALLRQHDLQQQTQER